MISLLLEINQEALTKSLNILWQGLLAVVVVVGIIIAVTYIMLYISKRIAENKEKKIMPIDEGKEDKTLDKQQ